MYAVTFQFISRVLLGFCFLFSFDVQASFGGFQPQVTYPAGSGPFGVVVADFTGDGNFDLAVTNEYDITFSILLGNGDGTFQPQTQYFSGSQPSGIGVADFTGNGILDLAVVNEGDYTVSILLGNGHGTFQPPLVYAVGTQPYGIAVADFTGNGIFDLAVTNADDGTVSILLGNGNGTFQPQVVYPVGIGPFGIAVGDFTGNGIFDLAVANANGNTISILLGNGDGTFQPQTSFPSGSGPWGIVVADFGGDGTFDLAVTNANDDTVGIFLGNGDGTFQPQITYAVGANPQGLVVADFNGDGKFDLAVTNNFDNNISILLQKTSTSTTLSASPNPFNPGQTVTLTAQVSPMSATGTVSFFDGSTLLGTVPLSGGTATFTTNSLAAGVNPITAVYNGNNQFATSPSSVVFVDTLLPPANILGCQVANKFATQTDYVNIITWSAPLQGPSPEAYAIYRDQALTQLLAVIPADKKLIFEEHNRKKGHPYAYFIVSSGPSGLTSEPFEVNIHACKRNAKVWKSH